MTGEQTIWLHLEQTSCSSDCELCALAWGGDTRLSGTMRIDVDVCWTTCRRGHRIRVRRIVNVGKHRRRRLRAA